MKPLVFGWSSPNLYTSAPLPTPAHIKLSFIGVPSFYHCKCFIDPHPQGCSCTSHFVGMGENTYFLPFPHNSSCLTGAFFYHLLSELFSSLSQIFSSFLPDLSLQLSQILTPTLTQECKHLIPVCACRREYTVCLSRTELYQCTCGSICFAINLSFLQCLIELHFIVLPSLNVLLDCFCS